MSKPIIKATNHFSSEVNSTLRLVFSKRVRAWKWEVKIDKDIVAQGDGTLSLVETIRLAEAEGGPSRHLLIPPTSLDWWQHSNELRTLAEKERWADLEADMDSATCHIEAYLRDRQNKARSQWVELLDANPWEGDEERWHVVTAHEQNANDTCSEVRGLEYGSECYYDIARTGAEAALEELEADRAQADV